MFASVSRTVWRCLISDSCCGRRASGQAGNMHLCLGELAHLSSLVRSPVFAATAADGAAPSDADPTFCSHKGRASIIVRDSSSAKAASLTAADLEVAVRDAFRTLLLPLTMMLPLPLWLQPLLLSLLQRYIRPCPDMTACTHFMYMNIAVIPH